MALEDKVAPKSDSQGKLTTEEEHDLSIMVTLAKNLIDDGGYKVIEQAQGSKDPAVIIGQFMMQLAEQLSEKLPFEPSPRIMMAHGGWVEEISDYLEEEYDVPRKVMDRAEIFIATSVQQMGQAEQQQGGEAQPEQGQQVPPMPQQQAPAIPQGGM